MCTCVLLHLGEHTLYRFRAGNVNSVTLSNKFTVSYGDIQMTVYSDILVYLERFKNLETGFFVKQYGYCSRSEQR